MVINQYLRETLRSKRRLHRNSSSRSPRQRPELRYCRPTEFRDNPHSRFCPSNNAKQLLAPAEEQSRNGHPSNSFRDSPLLSEHSIRRSFLHVPPSPCRWHSGILGHSVGSVSWLDTPLGSESRWVARTILCCHHSIATKNLVDVYET